LTSNNISSKDTANKNVPFPSEKSVQNDDLVHNNRDRKNIKRKDIKKLAEDIFNENGRGITLNM